MNKILFQNLQNKQNNKGDFTPLKIDYQLLTKCKLFDRIPFEDLPKAVNCLRGFTKNYCDKESVYSAGSDLENFVPGVVLSGKVQINQIYPDGGIVFLRNVEAGELFGVSLAYEDDENTFINACQNTTILFLHLPGKNYKNDCSCQYRMIILENLIQILATNNRVMKQKIQILSRPSLREKLLLFFANQKQSQKTATIQLNMTREKIAQYICAERSAVSRELSRMQDDGVIKIDGKSVTLL